jgi:antirestriction protein ArdC
MFSPTEIRQEITAQIIEALSNGTLPPWRRTWSNDANAPGLNTSLSTGSPYRGINQLILAIAAARRGFQSKWWGMFHQINASGAHVLRGEKGTHVVLYKPIKRTRIDENGDESDDSFCVLRTFVVFNAEQTNGLEKFRVGHATLDTHEIEGRFGEAERVIAATGANVRHGGNEAFYRRSEDFIQVPYRHQFDSPESFYETTFHELVHWTEHPTRLNWNRADEGYSMGELIAEIGSCFLMGELGLPTMTNLSNHAAYLQSWLKDMNGDPKFIFRASAQASKAAEFLLSFSRVPVESADPALA